MSKIERLNRMRRNILLGVLVGTGIAFVLLISPSFIPSSRHRWGVSLRWTHFFFYGALLIWLLTLLVFIVLYMLYKKKLKKDPTLQIAVNDERVRVNWLRAYRFAFYTLIVITIFWKLAETVFARALLELKVILPDGPWLVLFGAVLSVVSSFLYYNRELKDE